MTSEARDLTEKDHWRTPAIVGACFLIYSLNMTVVLNALPTMARAFGESLLHMNLVMTVFTLFTTVSVPFSGWLVDRMGARRLLECALVMFAAASVLCGLAQNLPQMLAARALQGVAGSVLIPVSRVIVLGVVPRHKVAGALALMTLPAMLGPMIGPVIGGFFVTFASWRWSFHMSLPVTLAAFVLLRAYVPPVPARDDPPPLDWPGALAISVGLGALIVASGNLSDSNMPHPVLAALFGVTTACLAFYALHARRAANPVVDLSLFRKRSFAVSVGVGAIVRVGLCAYPFLLAMLLQIGLGVSAFVAGLLTFVTAIGSLGMRVVYPPLLRRFGFRTLLSANTVAVGLSIAICAMFSPGVSLWFVGAVLAVSGVVQALHFTALNTLTFAELTPEEVSNGSATSAMINQLMMSVSVGLAAGLVKVVMRLRGDGDISMTSIGPAMAVAGALVLLTLPMMMRLPADVGADMHTRKSPDQAG